MTQSNSLAVKDLAHHMHPFTNLARHQTVGPFVISRGDGVYVIDERGNRFIEGMSGLWSVGLGFSEKRLLDAAMRQFSQLPYYHSFSHKAHEPGIELAAKIAQLCPEKLNHVHFTNSGSEANDTVIKIVWYHNNAIGRPEKKKFLSRRQAYHGSTVAAASLTGLPNSHRDFDLPAIPIRHLSCPHFYRFGLEGESEHEFVERLGRELEDAIEEEGAHTAMGSLMREGLQRMSAHPLVGEVRGAGLVAGVELVADKAEKRQFKQPGVVGAYIFQRAHEHGLIIRNIYDTIAFCPPLIISENQVKALLQAFERTLEDAERWVASNDVQ